jgi:hypothetical protein
VVGTRSGQSDCRHVAVADRLYLFGADVSNSLNKRFKHATISNALAVSVRAGMATVVKANKKMSSVSMVPSPVPTKCRGLHRAAPTILHTMPALAREVLNPS